MILPQSSCLTIKMKQQNFKIKEFHQAALRTFVALPKYCQKHDWVRLHEISTEHPFEGLEITLAALLNLTKLAAWMLRNLDSVNQNPAVGEFWKIVSHHFVFQGVYPSASLGQFISHPWCCNECAHRSWGYVATLRDVWAKVQWLLHLGFFDLRSRLFHVVHLKFTETKKMEKVFGRGCFLFFPTIFRFS